MSLQLEDLAKATAIPSVVKSGKTFFAGEDEAIKTGTFTGYKVATGTFTPAYNTLTTVNVGFKPLYLYVDGAFVYRISSYHAKVNQYSICYLNGSVYFILYYYDLYDEEESNKVYTSFPSTTALTLTSTGFTFKDNTNSSYKETDAWTYVAIGKA